MGWRNSFDVGEVCARYGNLWILYERFLLDHISSFAKHADPTEWKTKVKEGLVECLTKLDRGTAGSRLKKANSLLGELLNALKLTGSKTVTVDAKLVQRGLFGSSEYFGSAVLEVGMSWDPVLDLPVIPGSSVKGAVRSFCVEYVKKFKGLRREESESLCSALFGTSGGSGRAGVVSFLDALPVEAGEGGGLIRPDIINPHYNLSTNRSLRTELDVTPVPVLHLAVSEGTVFRFIIHVPRRAAALSGTRAVSEISKLARHLGISPKDDTSLTASLTAAFLLAGALRSGLGARTLKGYGTFELRGVRVYA